LEDVPDGGGLGVEVPASGGEVVPVAIFRTPEGVFAIEDACPHQLAPLHDGALTGTVVACALHGWVFDVRTGKPPVGEFPCVRRFDVRVEDGWVLVDL
jgi:nitrite reductase (NADH) small subunit